MRTNIEIDDELMERVMQVTGLKTKRAVVEEGLRTLIRLNDQKAILKLAGKVRWTGDLNESRQGRNVK
ncbi:MAG: type II toxin-antitoxin system VapB family antitoxin [Rhodospirillaceae bacterium]|nr:MAG: type II toxin-antitoxin system VapB family antitoxin [Rhodospirillaceae bacterium]